MGTDTWNEIFLFVAKLVQLKIIKHFFLRKPVSNFLGGIINKIFYYIAMKPLTIPWGHTEMPWMAVQESQGILYTLYINEVLKLWNAYLVLYFFLNTYLFWFFEFWDNWFYINHSMHAFTSWVTQAHNPHEKQMIMHLLAILIKSFNACIGSALEVVVWCLHWF